MDLTSLKVPYSAMALTKQYFNAGLQEMKALTPDDRTQLGSAIAKQLGIPVSELAFMPVEY